MDQAQQDSGEFMAVKKPAVKKTTAKKFKGVRREKHQQKEATDRRRRRLIPSDKTKEAAGKNGPSTGEG
jgi:hypothetical protein